MLAVVTYIEDIKIGGGWSDFDRCIHDNLDYVLGVDRHYYIARNPKDSALFYNMETIGSLDTQCVPSLGTVFHKLNVSYVNVQPPKEFRKAEQCFEWLHDFKHPEGDVCYIFGPNHGILELVPGANVSIKLKQSALYASSALAMVLYDREAKFETGLSSRPAAQRNECDGTHSS